MKRAEEDSWAGEVLDALDIGVFRIDNVAQRILRVNAKCAQIFGFKTPEDAVGYSALEMYEDTKERREVATRFAASDEFRRTGVARLEGRRVRIDNREAFDASICLRAVFDASGRATIIEGIISRIGGPSPTETAFRLGERRFRALFDTTAVPMALAQVDGTLSRVNKAFSSFLARDEAALLGANLFGLLMDDPRDPAAVHADERRFARGNGEVAWGQLSWTPISDDHGNPSAVVVIHDLTERKLIEENALRVAKLESLGVLAGGIAHDFNNVLAVVLGTLTLAARQPDAGPLTRALLVEAEQAADRARGLAGQLVTFAKGGEPVKSVGSIVPVVREAASFAARASTREVIFEESFADDLWLVDIDSSQMGQVFHNLLLNASEAMPRGGRVRIDAANCVVGPGTGVPLPAGRYVCVRVIDHGAGIEPRHLDRIFDPYFTTKATGTGLGLATAHSIVTRHGGHIGVKSEVGEGTTFTLHLPASPGRAVPASEPPFPSALPVRVLVMDDDDLVRRMTRQVLLTAGFDVVDCAEGGAAIAAYEAAAAAGRAFHAVILDLVVKGGMGGIETLARLRSLDPSVRAIVISGYSDDPVMSDCRPFGFVGAVAKPFTVTEIEDAVRAVVEIEPARPPDGPRQAPTS
jgi:PAS domain S-box-containing protein